MLDDEEEDSFGTHTMDKYKRKETVGNGAYGIVYKGVDTETEEVVAIKRIKIEVLFTPIQIAFLLIMSFRLKLREFQALLLERFHY